MNISIVIPAYNEADNIETTLEEFSAILGKIPGGDHEIIVIDDHSSDETYSIVKKHPSPYASCRRLSRQSGSHAAIRAGLAHATGSCVLVVSADGQEPADTLTKMLDEWKKGAHITWALRRSRADESLVSRILAISFYKLLTWLSEMPNEIDLARADFYLLDRIVVDALNQCQERNTSLFGLIVWIGFKHHSVDYDRLPRRHGSSRWSLHSRLRLAKDWILAFSSLPLRAITYFGFLFASFGFGYAVFIAGRALFFGVTEQGWASLITVVLLLGGVQMIMLGIIGEYIARNFDETRRRPVYFIEAETASSHQKNQSIHKFS